MLGAEDFATEPYISTVKEQNHTATTQMMLF